MNDNDGKSREDSHKGSGLGLAIVKEIIEYRKGEVWVESKTGARTCFYI